MLKDKLKLIKESIKDFKDDRKFLDGQIEKIEQRHKEKIEDAKLNYTEGYFLNQRLNQLEKEQQSTIYKMCEDFGNDASFHIIYDDGSECCVTGTEIVTGEITPKLQHIAYAQYGDGYEEFDTEIGNFSWDVSIDEEFEQREEYLNSVEIKFNTAWGIKHQNDIA